MADKTPLYTKIVEELRHKILNGEYGPYEQLPTEKELAVQYEVSLITSKRALSELEKEGLIYRKRGSGSYVKAIPAPNTATLQALGTPMIALILPSDKADSRLLDYIKGATEYLHARNCYVAVHTNNRNLEQERALLEGLPQRGFRGIICCPIDDIHHYDVLHMLYTSDFPLVLIDSSIDSLPLSYVTSDNFVGGYEGAKRLIQLGHERISFISGVPLESKASVRNRYFGHIKAHKDHGLPVHPSYSIFHLNQMSDRQAEDDLHDVIRHIREQGITAIQATNDTIAIRLMKASVRLGLKIPDDLSIIGFGDIEVSRHLDVPLTTISQNFFEIGRRAGELIYKKLADPTVSEQIKIPIKLVDRRSAGPALSSV